MALGAVPSDNLIETAGLTRRFGTVEAVRDLDLTVRRGEIFGFLGPNGAGKTTTIRMLVGLLQPSAGSARIAGYDILTQPLDAKARIGFVPDEPILYDKLTAREFIYFKADLYSVEGAQARRRADELLRLFDLEDRADDLLESYSHGMRQKAALAGALIHNPPVLILDEPTVGLDPKSARLIKDILRQLSQRGGAIFMSTHILEIAERMCDRIGIIDHGRLVAAGTMDELRSGAGAATSLEDIFLGLTGGPEYAAIADILA